MLRRKSDAAERRTLLRSVANRVAKKLPRPGQAGEARKPAPATGRSMEDLVDGVALAGVEAPQLVLRDEVPVVLHEAVLARAADQDVGLAVVPAVEKVV